MNGKIDYSLIERSFGCGNCIHEDDGRWDDFCRVCDPNRTPPGKYRPARNTIQEKVYYDKRDKITYREYLRFLGSER